MKLLLINLSFVIILLLKHDLKRFHSSCLICKVLKVDVENDNLTGGIMLKNILKISIAFFVSISVQGLLNMKSLASDFISGMVIFVIVFGVLTIPELKENLQKAK